MALNVMSWVWDHSRSKNGARLVLLAIADNASSDGGEAWPSIKELCRKANLSHGAVFNALDALVALGELEIQSKAGRGTAGGPGVTNRYRIIMTGSTPAAPAPKPPAPTPGKVTQRNNSRPETSPESGGVQDLDVSNIWTRAESAPVQNLGEGVQILTGNGPDSGHGSVLEPPRTKTTAALTLDGLPPAAPVADPGPAADAAGRDPVTGRYPRTAQGLVGWWIDEIRRDKHNPEYLPPGRVLGHVARLLREMLAEGTPFDAVSRGLQLWWQAKGVSSPSVLPSIVNDVLAGNVTPMRESGRPRAGQAASVQAPTTEGEMIL